MKIFVPDASDADRIREIYLDAFDETEGEMVAELAVDLLAEKSVPPSIHLVAQEDGRSVGHVSFSSVTQKGNQKHIGSILAPVAVDPAWQKRGIGSALVREGLRCLGRRECGMVFVYGDPKYYGRFGFRAELAESFLPPHPLLHPFGWQALKIGDCETPEAPVSIECVRALDVAELW